MKKIANLLLIFAIGFSITNCGLFSKNKKNYEIQYPPELAAVDKKVKKKKYFEAHDKIDAYLKKSENLEYFGVAYFLKGYIYELQGDEEKTIEFYRRAIKHTSKFNSLVEAKALYNLSFTYERANDFDSVMSVLTDLVQRPKYFRPITAKVETRARMGAALGSLGQMEKAKKFHSEAEQYYYKMSRENFFKPSKLALTKALYYLGVVVYDSKNEKFNNLRDKLNWGQTHLLACTEASTGSWSRKAANRLLLSYDKMWQLIKAYKPMDKDLDPQTYNKMKDYRQLEMASDFYDILRKIRPEEFPIHKDNRYSRIVVDTSDKWMNVLQDFVLTLEVGPELIRDKKVKQRPIFVEIAEAKAKPKKEKKPKALPPPIGVQISSEIQKEMEIENAKKSEELKAELKSQFKTKQDKDIMREKDKKSKFIPLPEKDPNL